MKYNYFLMRYYYNTVLYLIKIISNNSLLFSDNILFQIKKKVFKIKVYKYTFLSVKKFLYFFKARLYYTRDN